MEGILGHTRWVLESAATVDEVFNRLRRQPSVVLVIDAILPGGTWKDVLSYALGQPSPPPVIVAAQHADDNLWMEVLNSGGYNVITKPFEPQEVFRVITMAWLHGRRRTQAFAQSR